MLDRGWSPTKKAFVQRYGSDALDASALMMLFVGFLPPNDPRMVSTVERVQEELAQGPFLHRYVPDLALEGVSGGEGAFVMLSFWLAGALLYIGQVEKAAKIFQELLKSANHLGLYSEMVSPESRELLGNFPQAFSHLGLLHTARNLTLVLERGQPLLTREAL